MLPVTWDGADSTTNNPSAESAPRSRLPAHQSDKLRPNYYKTPGPVRYGHTKTEENSPGRPARRPPVQTPTHRPLAAMAA